KWLKNEGDPIAKDEPIVEIITDKINIELPAPSAGTLGKITIPEGTVAQVGQQLGVILAKGESMPAGNGAAAPQQQQQPQAPQKQAPQQQAPQQQAAPRPGGGAAVAEAPPQEDQRVSPAVRKLLKEHQLDVAGIRGSGMGGRVTREDVLNHIEGS